MKIGIVIYSNDSETVWNAFRFGAFAVKQGDSVTSFLLGKGVECETLDSDRFKVTEQMRLFVEGGGKILACGTCLKIRHSEGSDLCPVSTMQDLYELVRDSEKIVSF
ncbi:MAG: DsrE family protein [Gammaproteobacteria bacterium]